MLQYDNAGKLNHYIKTRNEKDDSNGFSIKTEVAYISFFV